MIKRIAPALAALCFFAAPALAQDAAPKMGLWDLFKQSFDLFTILLVSGSLVGMTVIFVCVLEIREAKILPLASTRRIKDLLHSKRYEDLKDFIAFDSAFVSRSLRGAVSHIGEDKSTIREVAELAASEESARWFRKIELLNVIGNLGPLIGLAGTVWGMILAFTSLGEAGGQSQAANLSLGISKALFHTLLGLCLAIPCLAVFGIYRATVDRICTKGMMLTSEIVEELPAGEASVERAGITRAAEVASV